MRTRIVLAVAYLACILAANAALERWGMITILGAMVPAGVFFAGATFSLRDMLDDEGGLTWVLAAIVLGAALSAIFAPAFALASGAAFLLAELLDLAVYRPLRDRRWWLAVIASNVAGSIADSLLFLRLAFHTTDGWLALTIAKAAVTAPFLAVMWWRRRR